MAQEAHGQMARFQEILRRLAIFDAGFATAGSGHDLAGTPTPDPKTAALPQARVPVISYDN